MNSLYLAAGEAGLWDKPLDREVEQAQAALRPVSVDHVVDRYRCYPGETLTFFTRLALREPAQALTLRLSIPDQIEISDYQAPAPWNELKPVLEVGQIERFLVWHLAGDHSAETTYEFQLTATILPLIVDVRLASQASVSDAEDIILAQESVRVAVRAKGRYLQHLPSIYERDELMGRFLMLFESFWAPIENQVGQIDSYFDPRLTPPDFLPWLASWLDLDLDERWPRDRVRELLRWTIALHRSRGTKWGLLKYVELYTGRQAEIIERRATDFRLGSHARLGPGIALGQGNTPHTFTVKLRLPPVEAETDEERQWQETLRRRTIESIIDMQKPAHTVYVLNLELDTDLDTSQLESRPPLTNGYRQQDEIAAHAATWFKLDE